MRVLFYTALVMTAIAGDSFFTKLALSTTDIDHFTFSLLRIFSASLILVFVIPVYTDAPSLSKPRIFFLSTLFILYSIAFSYAYTQLSISVGGLILFAVTQLCSILFGAICLGKRLNPIQWFGFLVASLGGLSLLAPSITGENSSLTILAMSLAGLAWSALTITTEHKSFSIFSLRKVFKFTAVIISFPLAINLITTSADSNIDGYIYALLCGALTTALGYALWLIIANSITPITTAIVRILAPLITISFGMAFLSESFSTAATSASTLIIFGIGILLLSEYLKSVVACEE